jgi:hypothetical protein
MAEANLSPIEKVLEKRKEAKELPGKIYEKIFDLGVEKTAKVFNVKPEEAVKLAYKIVRKKGDFDKFQELAATPKLNLICDKIEELRSFSTTKIYEECKTFADVWEITIAKNILKRKLKQEYWD